jgi:transposase, IS30 family
MKKKKKLTFDDRCTIESLINRDLKKVEIARVLQRSPGTISDEINGKSVNGRYTALGAQQKTQSRQSNKLKDWKKINKNNALREYIIKGLKNHWNPDEISGRMRLEKKPFYASKTAIYEWLRSPRGQYYCRYLYSRRYEKKERKVKKTKRVMIPNRVGIEERPRGATNRTRYGHTEADTIVSGKNTRSSSAISVLYERKSRYIDARRLNTLKPDEHNNALKNMMKDKQVLSTTFDNGIENKNHQELGVSTFFCDAYSSWQKGGVENINKMVRRHIPKGSSLKDVSEEKLAWVVDIINNKPRKILGYRTAYEVALQSGYLIEEYSD